MVTNAKKVQNWILFSVSFSLDVQLKPYRTDEFVHRLYYETSRFVAFSHQWVLKVRVNNSQLDITQNPERSMMYQVSVRR